MNVPGPKRRVASFGSHYPVVTLRPAALHWLCWLRRLLWVLVGLRRLLLACVVCRQWWCECEMYVSDVDVCHCLDTTSKY
jgi:hypothetical protein